MKHNRLVVRLTSKRTGAIHKFGGNEWVSAACFMDMATNGLLDPNEYNAEFRRAEMK